MMPDQKTENGFLKNSAGLRQQLEQLKAAQVQHERTEDRLAKISECFLDFSPDPDENINRLTELTGKLFGATCALYNRLDQGMLCSTGQWNTPPDYNPVDKPEGHICYDVIRRSDRGAFVVRNLLQTTYAQTDPNVKSYQLQTYVGQVVKLKDEPVGSLCVVFQKDFAPTAEDKTILGILASAVGVEEERKQAATELKAHQDHLEELVEQRTTELIRINHQLRQVIDERGEVEKRLQRQTEELASLLEVSRAVASTLDLAEVISIIAEQTVKLIGVGGCTLSRWDRQADAVVTWIEWRSDEGSSDDPGSTYPLAKFPTTRQVLEERRPLAISTSDYSAFPIEVAYMQQTGAASLLMLPLLVRNRVIGLMELDDERQREFTPAEIRLCQALADQAAVAIDTAQLYEQAQQEIEERKRMEAELQRLYQQAKQDAAIKSSLLREVNHRIKNNLSAIIGLLYAERHHPGVQQDNVYQTIMADLINRVNGLAIVHKLLSDSEWQSLRLSDMVQQLIQATLQWLPSEKTVSVVIPPSPSRVTSKQANNLALVINELATNTSKYALLDRDVARITVKITLKNDTVRLEYRDDGPGYPEEVLQQEAYSVGMYLIQTLVRDGLHGVLSLNNDQGAVTVIEFKPDDERLDDG